MADVVFWDEREMDRASAFPNILAIGDSWFWYPFPGGSLLNNLGELLRPNRHVVLAKGMNGAEAFDYVDGKYAGFVREALRLHGSALNAVFISGGGNDFAGFNDLRPLLKDDCSAETGAPGCFADGPTGFKAFFEGLDDHYRRLIGVIYTRTGPDCKIVMHTYDYAVPNGVGVFGSSKWLKPALVSAAVPDHLHQACVTHLIDTFAAMLIEIAKTDPQHLFVVDSRNTLTATHWANELHPKPAGFRKIALDKWKPVLVQAGLV